MKALEKILHCLLAALVASVLLSMFITICSCAWLKPSCEVIKIAADTCTMIEIADDAGVHRVQVTPGELAALAHTVQARRPAGGAP